jgi:thiosulfate/3-mercaptopyruvate sulfurtransferase
MPGARNIPFDSLISDGRMKSRDELKAVFDAAHVDPSQPAICSCGSGITAGLIALALARLGRWDAAVYDGSWAEWGAQPDTPIATGPA